MSPYYRISFHVPSHPTDLIRHMKFDRGQVGAMCNSMTHSWFVGHSRVGPLDRRLRGIPKDLRIDGPCHFKSLAFGSSSCIIQLPLWNTPSLFPHVPRIHSQDLLWIAEIWGNSCIPTLQNT
jgi:hypothetical protein